MKTSYETGKGLKLATEDDYKQGEIGQSSEYEINVEFKGNSVSDVLKKISSFFDAPIEHMSFNGDGEEPGRVDVGVMENGNGDHASIQELSAWKNRKVKLWSVTYTFYIEKVTRLPAKI